MAEKYYSAGENGKYEDEERQDRKQLCITCGHIFVTGTLAVLLAVTLVQNYQVLSRLDSLERTQPDNHSLTVSILADNICTFTLEYS